MIRVTVLYVFKSSFNFFLWEHSQVAVTDDDGRLSSLHRENSFPFAFSCEFMQNYKMQNEGEILRLTVVTSIKLSSLKRNPVNISPKQLANNLQVEESPMILRLIVTLQYSDNRSGS